MRNLALPGCLLLITACGSNAPNTDGANNSAIAANSSNAAAQAGAESADNSANGDSAVSNSAPFKTVPLQGVLDGNFLFDGCQVSLAGAISNGSANANVVLNSNNCAMGRQISGTETFVGTILGAVRQWQVTVDANITLASGDVVTVTSFNPNSPTYTLDANGYGNPNATVTLDANINEHRTRHTASGTAVYDMDITTSAPITLHDVYNASALLAQRQIVSGSNSVHHLLDKYVAVNTYANVTRTVATCNCPDGGTITQNITLDADSPLGTGTFTKTYDFAACGTGTFTVTASTVSSVGTTGESATGTFIWDSCSAQ